MTTASSAGARFWGMIYCWSLKAQRKESYAAQPKHDRTSTAAALPTLCMDAVGKSFASDVHGRDTWVPQRFINGKRT